MRPLAKCAAAATVRLVRTPALELPLTGAGGEPVDLWRTIVSHGVASLPPQVVDEDARTLDATLIVRPGRVRTVRVTAGRPGHVRVEVLGRAPARSDLERLVATVRHMLRLDEDLSAFYGSIAADADLSWAASGAGRMLRSPTVFEDVVKTICTTNCAWSGTIRMVSALVEHLGVEDTQTRRRAFPTAEAMAEAKEPFYRDVARAGYRGAYLRALAADVASGELDLEQLNDPELGDDEVAERLLALPGVGPYAAAHVMMLLPSRHSRLVLDSWTRPKYARLTGKKSVADKTIERRFKRYNDHAGLAFWLYVTRDWVAE
jgi:N-glycosylase/DNA lyase